MHSTSAQTRRAFLGRTTQGLGSVALASLLQPQLLNAASRGVLGTLPLPQKAKRVIWLTMAGGPSQLELFDHKPKLAEMDGQPAICFRWLEVEGPIYDQWPAAGHRLLFGELPLKKSAAAPAPAPVAAVEAVAENVGQVFSLR